VRDAAGELPDALQALCLVELPFVLLALDRRVGAVPFGLQVQPFGDVVQEGVKAQAGGREVAPDGHLDRDPVAVPVLGGDLRPAVQDHAGAAGSH